VKQISWARGFTINLPFPDNVFDLVVSSLVIHHLNYEDKLRTFREVARILSPGGRFCIADFGPPHDGLMRLVIHWMIYMEKVADNFHGAIPGLLREAGFYSIEESIYVRTIFGPLRKNKKAAQVINLGGCC
jgi:ubiquinone/menaquinone biosynthesis C-methylase UbiE